MSTDPVKLGYLFAPPGWSHDGTSKTARQLRALVKDVAGLGVAPRCLDPDRPNVRSRGRPGGPGRRSPPSRPPGRDGSSWTRLRQEQ